MVVFSPVDSSLEDHGRNGPPPPPSNRHDDIDDIDDDDDTVRGSS